MALKIAFSTVACPDWTLAKVAEQAKAMGYDGVELRTMGGGSTGLASDPALSSPAKLRDVFADAGIEIACLSTSLALHHRHATDAHRAKFEIERHLDAAAEMGCEALRLFGYEVGPGENHRTVIQRIAGRLPALADKAGDVGVQLLFENAGSFSVAKEWWWLLDMVNHPMVGLVWNIANSAAADANDKCGWVSVPMLNSRIRIAKIKDTHIGEGSGYVQLGDGTVGIKTFINRLMGVGFTGYLSVEWDRLWLPALAPAEEYLPEALTRLRGWIKAIEDAGSAAREGKEKAEAKDRTNREKAMAKARGGATDEKAAAQAST